MASRLSNLDPNIEVAFLSDSRCGDNAAVLVSKSSCCEGGSFFLCSLTEHLPPSSTRSRNEFLPYVFSKYSLMEAAPCEPSCQQGVTFSKQFIGVSSPALSHAGRLNRNVQDINCR